MVTVGNSALAEVDLVIARGADFDCEFRYSTGQPPAPVDLTGWSARAQIRGDLDRTLWLTLDTEITLGSDGTISIHLPYTATEDDAWSSRRNGYWNLELTSPLDRRIRFAEGAVSVSQDVTRDD